MRREDLVAFARRDWQAIAASKRQRWAMLKLEMTASDALSVGDELRHHMSGLHGDAWPSDREREEDLALHFRVSEALRSVKSSHRR